MVKQEDLICNTCLVQTVCTKMCPEVIEYYKKEIVIDPNYNTRMHGQDSIKDVTKKNE